MNPKVSVIVPIYKAEQYLERCIRSLMEQTLVEMEYIFINYCRFNISGFPEIAVSSFILYINLK